MTYAFPPSPAAGDCPVSDAGNFLPATGRTPCETDLRIVVEGYGLPDAERLRAAVGAVARTGTASRPVRVGTGRVAQGPPPTVVHAAPHACPLDVTAADTVRLLTGRADAWGLPGREVLVVPGEAGARTALVFSASPALMGGHGLLAWAQEVFRVLRGEPAVVSTGPETVRAVRAPASCRLRAAPLPGRPSPFGPATRGAPAQTLWLRRTLPRNRRGMTARLTQALADVSGLDTRVIVPAAPRHRPSSTRGVVRDVGPPLFLDTRPGLHWSAVLSRPQAAPCGPGALASGHEAELYLASAAVCHLGAPGAGTLSGGGFNASTAYALPTHSPVVPLSFTVVETAGATEVVLGLRAEGPDLAERAGTFLDSVLEHTAAGISVPRRAVSTGSGRSRRNRGPRGAAADQVLSGPG
ncbi:hypothetical protein ACIQWN_32565 [Streptomyces vinaceus]|uniref:hypothetical protein n=1 Tax=Streptomyces vinaceus TaxID=1960 RepID=UPI00382AE5A9